MTTTYTTITDVISAVRVILGEYAKDYDIDAIAHDITSFDEHGRIVADLDRSDFYAIADRHDTTTYYRYFAHVSRMLLTQGDETYVERDEDGSTGRYYAEEYFDTEEEAIAYVRSEIADYVARELDGKGYKVIRTRRALDTVEYAEGTVERHLFSGIDDEVIDYGNEATEHFYDGYYECSLPNEVREKADAIMRGYHRYLDYQSDSYGSLADELNA